MKKAHAVIIITVFLSVISAFSVMSVFDKDKAISEKENRTLVQMPKLTLKTLIDGSFAKGFEAYYSDQFPLRDFMLNISFKFSSLMAITGKDDVALVEGGDGMIIDPNEGLYSPDNSATPEPTASPTVKITPDASGIVPSQSLTEVPRETPTPTPIPDSGYEYDKRLLRVGDRILEIYWYNKQMVEPFFKVLNRFAGELPDVTIYSLLTPSSVAFYTPDKYKGYGHSQREAIDYAFSGLDNRIKRVDVYDNLEKHTNEYIYFRTDHHWTQRGAYYAYEEFCRSAGFSPSALSSFKTDKITDYLGTYYKYVPEERFRKNPDYVELFYPDINTGYVYNDISMRQPTPIKVIKSPSEMSSQSLKYLTFINGDNPLTYFKTNVENGKKILMFKDSYGNAFTPFLLSHYEEVYIIDARRDEELSSVMDFIKQKGIQEILFLNYINCPTQSNAYQQLNNMLD